MNKKLAILFTCSALFVCTACTEDPAVTKDCTNDEVICEGQILKVCNNGTWEETTCTESQTCNADAKKCDDHNSEDETTCQNGDAECNGQTLKVCNNGTWEETTCTESQICDPIKKDCVSANDAECDYIGISSCNKDLTKYMECGEDYKWIIKDECSATEVCNASEKKCIEKICDEGTVECAENTLKKCIDNNWQETPCDADSICNAKTQICECEEDKSICSDENTLKTCNANVWTTKNCATEGLVCDADSLSCQLPAAGTAEYTTVKAIHDDFSKFVDLTTCANNEVKTPDAQKASVILEGVVTAIKTSKEGFYLQEVSTDGKHAGIYIHCPASKEDDPRNWPECAESLNVGDNVRVTADSIGNVKCQLEVYQLDTPVKVEKTGGTATVTPIELTANDINNNNDLNNPYNGTLAIIKGMTILEKVGADGWMMKDANENQVKLQYWLVLTGMNSIIETGKKFDVTGIIANYKIPGIQPRNTEDMKELK